MKNNKPPTKQTKRTVANNPPQVDAATKKARVDAAVLSFIQSLPALENQSDSDEESDIPFFLTVKSKEECKELVEAGSNSNDIEDYSSAWLAILQEVFEGVTQINVDGSPERLLGFIMKKTFSEQRDPQEDSDSEEDEPEPVLLSIELLADIAGLDHGVSLTRVSTTNPYATRNLWLEACPKVFTIKKKT